MYSEAEREKIQEKMHDPANVYTGMNMSLGYALYDTMLLQLNELHRIRKSMESIEKIISEQQNR